MPGWLLRVLPATAKGGFLLQQAQKGQAKGEEEGQEDDALTEGG